MRIGLITTLNSNIGDDFIREGLCSVIQEIAGQEDITFVPINKHDPISLYPEWHPLRRMRNLPIGGYRKRLWLRQASRIFRSVGRTKFDDCDAIVQCGAPVYWQGCGTNTDWHEDIWKDVVGRLYRRIPVLNLAAGSCFSYLRQPERFDPRDAHYARWLFRLCRATSVRDTLAKKLLSAAGCEPELIRCSAFLYTSPAQAERTADGPILINYMPGGGHFDWDQKIDGERWAQTVRDLIARLQPRHRVVMLCHDKKELSYARALTPNVEAILPPTFADFPRMVRQAKAALCNRLHASVALAGLGIPSIAVGTDTRLLMVKHLDHLPCHFVGDTDAAQLERELETIFSGRDQIAAKLAKSQQETRDAYARILRQQLPFVTAGKSSARRETVAA